MDATNVAMSAAVEGNPAFSELIRQSTPLVVQELNFSLGNVQWDARRDKENRQLLVLHVDGGAQAEANAEFAPDELRNEAHFRERLHALKGGALLVGQWRSRMDQLITNVKDWVSRFNEPVRLNDKTFMLRDDASGPYSAPGLSLEFRGKSIALQPRGFSVVDAEGLAWLAGPVGFETLVYRNGNWFWVTGKQEQLFQTLDGELLLGLLARVSP